MGAANPVSQGNSIYDQYGIDNKPIKRQESEQDQFMKLMLAQLKHQDPMSPMENGEFLTQIAQFNTASGIKELQGQMGTLVDSLQSNQALQASSLVGRSVLVPGNSGYLEKDGSIGGSIVVPQGVTNCTLKVYDAKGQLVASEELGPQTKGETFFMWDGKNSADEALPEGIYKIEVTSSINGKATSLDTNIAARVGSVSIGSAGRPPMLNLIGLGPYSFEKVQQIM